MSHPLSPPCLKLILAFLLLGLLALPAQAARDHFYFVQITDTHFGSDDNLERGRRVVERINQLPMPVAFVVHTGDILADLILDPRVVDQTLEVMSGLQPPLYYIPGNHEVSSEYLVPIRHQGRMHGVLNLESTRGDFFTAEVCAVFDAIAEQIAALQAQYRKLEEAEQRRALHAFLHGVRQRAETRCLNEIAG